MEQQQNDLFAMIGELTYRLQLVEREKERLEEENQTLARSVDSLKTEVLSNDKTIQFLQTNYNSAMRENQLISTELDQTRMKNEDLDKMLRAAENALDLGHPVRQYNRIEYDDEISCVDTEYDPLSVEALYTDMPELEEITPSVFDKYGFVTGYDGLPWNPTTFGSDQYIKC
jgi:chromosome segregation ATPase